MHLPIRQEKQLYHVRTMSTLELLDRVTVLREGMESDALELFHAELASRGIGPEEIGDHHRQMRLKSLQHIDGMPACCYHCGRVAVTQRMGWHRLWGLLPLFRRRFYCCEEHS
ncbi:MAG TPA: hypothetical protein PKA06_12790 [Gemmatales bacterium]|nr:hypothetical protein [Gemmatales bacterium]HMP18052.1 hypothetical protein [Gemmatales bacterium]